VTTRYTFGDGDVAAERLALLADVFEPTSRRLMAKAPRGAALAVDLGCGPGYTTRLLATVTAARATVGLDVSADFVSRAEALVAAAGSGAPSGVSFAAHDVTAVPFPLGGRRPDVAHARFLLAHLPDAAAVVDRWRGELAPGGVLLLDELEDIQPPPGVLRDYEELVTALVASEGADMYAGRALAGLGGEPVAFDVDAPVAARMFGMNLATWGDDAVRRGLVDREGIERLAAGLASVTGGTARWVHRQFALPA
jgi:SAM-dependent methyltransferase